jgi:hypothetical protein
MARRGFLPEKQQHCGKAVAAYLGVVRRTSCITDGEESSICWIALHRFQKNKININKLL